MSVLFLDIDGVLNSGEWQRGLEDRHVEQLVALLSEAA